MSVYRPEFEVALRLLARVSDDMDAADLPRPILVGGAAVEFYTGGHVVTGDFDLCSPAQPELEAILQNHGFERPRGVGKLLRGWVHPALALGFEIVAASPMDGAVAVARLRLVRFEDGSAFRILGVEDMIADRMGQVAAFGGSRVDMQDQAR